MSDRGFWAFVQNKLGFATRPETKDERCIKTGIKRETIQVTPSKFYEFCE